MATLAQQRTGDRELAEKIESIASLAAEAVDDLRALAHGIYPVMLASSGARQEWR